MAAMECVDVVVVIACIVVCVSVILVESAEAARKAKRAHKYCSACNDATSTRASSDLGVIAAAPYTIPESAAARALDSADTLRVVLDYAGAGEWLFLSTVSAAWCDGCRRIASNDVQTISIYRRRTVTLAATTTRASAVFASPSRVAWAQECGLELANSTPSLQIVAGFSADLLTLAAAKQGGLPLSADVLRGAALSSDLVKLKSVHNVRSRLSCAFAYDVAK
jgi:hypothetical protein